MLPEVASADYHGAYQWDDVAAHLPRAVAAVRELMGFNVPEGEGQAAAYKAAVCAALDVDAAYGFSGGVAEGLQSVTLGSVSLGMGQEDGRQSAYDRDMRRAVARELRGTGLLYAGLG